MVQIYVPKQCLGLQPDVSRAHRIFFYVQISCILSEMTSNVALILRNCENASKLLMDIKTLKTKSFLYSVQGARCSSQRKFDADRRIIKHC